MAIGTGVIIHADRGSGYRISIEERVEIRILSPERQSPANTTVVDPRLHTFTRGSPQFRRRCITMQLGSSAIDTRLSKAAREIRNP